MAQDWKIDAPEFRPRRYASFANLAEMVPAILPQRAGLGPGHEDRRLQPPASALYQAGRVLEIARTDKRDVCLFAWSAGCIK